jgi:tetratricopeptide (TPR) repeat protein
LVDEEVFHGVCSGRCRSVFSSLFPLPSILFNLGIASTRLNRLPEAEKIYQKVLAIKPDFIEAHNN